MLSRRDKKGSPGKKRERNESGRCSAWLHYFRLRRLRLPARLTVDFHEILLVITFECRVPGVDAGDDVRLVS